MQLHTVPSSLQTQWSRQRVNHPRPTCHAKKSPRPTRHFLSIRSEEASTAGEGGSITARIAAGKDLYAARDRMGALAQFEEATRLDGSQSDMAAAWYNIACVHASFGDVEPAQQALRTAIVYGIELEAALTDPTLLKMTASPQVIIQLKKFATAVSRQRAEAIASAGAPPTPPRPTPTNRAPSATSSTASSSKGSSSGNRSWRSGLDEDLSDILMTENSQGIDSSVGAILRRVSILLLAGVGLGTGLFYLGLKYLFPEAP